MISQIDSSMEFCDLVCKVLHVEDIVCDKGRNTVFFVWDSSDAKPQAWGYDSRTPSCILAFRPACCQRDCRMVRTFFDSKRESFVRSCFPHPVESLIPCVDWRGSRPLSLAWRRHQSSARSCQSSIPILPLAPRTSQRLRPLKGSKQRRANRGQSGKVSRLTVSSS